MPLPMIQLMQHLNIAKPDKLVAPISKSMLRRHITSVLYRNERDNNIAFYPNWLDFISSRQQKKKAHTDFAPFLFPYDKFCHTSVKVNRFKGSGKQFDS